MRTVLLKVFSPWKSAQNVNQYEIHQNLIMFCLLTHLFVFTFHAETHDVRGFFLGVWLLTKVPWTTQPNYLLHRWKLQVCFKKHPSFLSSKHSTSALYFCWLWFVIFYLKPLNQQCCKFRIPNVFRLLFELNKCYQSHLSHILAIFTVALSGCWEDNTLVRNRWSVAGKKQTSTYWTSVNLKHLGYLGPWGLVAMPLLF